MTLIRSRVGQVHTGRRAAEHGEVGSLAKNIQAATDQAVEIAFVDQRYSGARVSRAAAAHRIQLEVVKLSVAKCGFVLLPRRGGRRKIVRRDHALPEAGPVLRTMRPDHYRHAPDRLRLPHAQNRR